MHLYVVLSKCKMGRGTVVASLTTVSARMLSSILAISLLIVCSCLEVVDSESFLFVALPLPSRQYYEYVSESWPMSSSCRSLRSIVDSCERRRAKILRDQPSSSSTLMQIQNVNRSRKTGRSKQHAQIHNNIAAGSRFSGMVRPLGSITANFIGQNILSTSSISRESFAVSSVMLRKYWLSCIPAVQSAFLVAWTIFIVAVTCPAALALRALALAGWSPETRAGTPTSTHGSI